MAAFFVWAWLATLLKKGRGSLHVANVTCERSGGILLCFLILALGQGCGGHSDLGEYRIVVSTSEGLDSDLLLLDGAGRLLRRLTHTPDRAEMWPAWGGGNRWIYFEARGLPDKRVMICRLDLESDREDTLYGPALPGELWYALSPDGRKLAYVSRDSTRTGVIVRDLLTGSPTEHGRMGFRLIRPAWSPDSRRLVCQIRQEEQRQWDLAIIDVDSGRMEVVMASDHRTEFKARWSRDSASLVYSSAEQSTRKRARLETIDLEVSRPVILAGEDRGRFVSGIWSSRGELAALRERPLPLAIFIWPDPHIPGSVTEIPLPKAMRRGRLVWSPDGKYIAANVTDGLRRGRGFWKILLLDHAGRVVKNWPTEYEVYCPAWAPLKLSSS